MFRSFVYLDTDKFYTYKRQIDGGNLEKPKSISQKHTAGVATTIKKVAVNATTEMTVDRDFVNDVSIDYDHFEIDLNKLEGEDYFDCVLNDDYDLATVPAMKLIRLCSSFEIPEAFDAVNLIDRFMPMLMGQVTTQSDAEQEALENILGNASADIPFAVEFDDITVAGKLNAKYLHEEYANLEDYADQDVYMLCKVVGIIRKDEVEIFDPLKDFIRLPRNMRRQMAANGKSVGLDKISVEGPVLKVEVIAIYK